MKPEVNDQPLILGIDGGGTKTVAVLGQVNVATDEVVVLSRGFAGPSNQRAVGPVMAMGNLDKAVQFAFDSISLPRQTVAAACLGLAGADRDSDRSVVERWANEARLAAKVRIVNDAAPILFANSQSGTGIALIAGTGSLAYGRNADNRIARSGGWGYLFGDEGSAFAIGRAVLIAAVRATDGRGQMTWLLENVQRQLSISTPSEIVAAVYGDEIPRAVIASLAPLAFAGSEVGDVISEEVVRSAASDLSEMVIAVAKQLNLLKTSIAFSGALLVAHETLRFTICSKVNVAGVEVTSSCCVEEPALGALQMAQQLTEIRLTGA